MSEQRTHELKLYVNAHHKHLRFGELEMHLWFIGEHVMQMDLDVALSRPDIAFVDVIDCVNHTTERVYPK
jgi:hypothetical protein